ncbi:tetratricopeptide repeat-containing sensor histidine kinase [Lewinella cohaerens]|uniref:tetratricopeptide repeat-containing sensor histidine kinase n=1 Tax=Lewinella cohaerens TaxID=70995 RepID=UPI00036F976E|nr:histidine kinase dimerization/phosphoacceptor domain -containing protein [Lewinella cohaerens]
MKWDKNIGIALGFLCSLWALAVLPAVAQSSIVDSLRVSYLVSSNDSISFERYYELTNAQLDIDSSAFMASLDTLKKMAVAQKGTYYIGRCAFLEARMYSRNSDIKQQRNTLEKALVSFEEANSKENIASTYYAMARTWLPEGDYEKASIYYQKALVGFKALDNREYMANALNALGVVQRRAGNLDEAVEYLKQAAIMSREQGQVEGEATALMNQAVIHKQRKEYDQAIPLYKRALELAAGPPSNEGMAAYIYNNLSSLYSDQKRYELALDALEMPYQFFAANGNKREQAAVTLGMATNLQGLKRYEESIRKYRETIALSKEELFFLRDAHTGISQAFTLQGKLDSALYHLGKGGELDRQLADETRLQALAEVEARYKNKEQQLQIEALAKEDQRKQRAIIKRNWTLVTGGVVLLLLSLLLYSMIRQRTKISAQNQIIQKSLKEKELLVKEIHHRVKNNLQMVSSLLNLQSRHLTDAAAVDALQLSKSRVRSMAMIHQSLYTGSEVSTSVDAKAYLEQLCEEIIGTYESEQVNITLETAIVPLEMDIETLIPLGLLVNEAITNAVKYAFVGRSAGQLTLALQKSHDQLYLRIEDDGLGLDAGGSKGKNNNGFGTLLMETLAEQLGGELKWDSSPKGTRLHLYFDGLAIA